MPPDQLDRADDDAIAERPARVRELLRLFLRLGLTAFGGPAVHIALMEDAIVERRRWLPRERFLTLLGITNLLPGPNSTEMAMHIGHVRAGAIGLVVAGAAFILPAAVMSAALAWFYVRYQVSPPVIGVLYGLKPVVVAVVLQALWRLGRSALRTPALAIVAVVTTAVAIIGAHELVVLLAGGILHVAIAAISRARDKAGDHTQSQPPDGSPMASAALLPASASAAVAGARTAIPPGTAAAAAATGAATTASVATAAAAGIATAAPGLLQIFLVFLKIGSVLFGSGYVLLLFLRADVVQRYHWITETQLVDAIAIGQIVPGPVTTTCTFIGYFIGGLPGAVVATVGVFLPAFCFVAASGPLVAFVERSPLLQAFVDGVVAASLALVAIVTYDLGRAALIDPPTILIAVASAVAVMRYRVNPVWPVLIAACVGLGIALS